MESKHSQPLKSVVLTLEELEEWLKTQPSTSLAASEFGFVADYARSTYGVEDAFIGEVGEERYYAELSRIDEEDVPVQMDAGTMLFYFKEMQSSDMNVEEALQLVAKAHQVT